MKKLLLSVLFAIIWLWVFSNIGYCEGDHLEGAISKSTDYLITSDTGQSEKVLNGGDDSFIVKWSQLLMQIAVWLGIFVILFGWIKFMTTVWDEGKMKENKESMLIAMGGLIVVLSAYFILEVMQSIWTDFEDINLDITTEWPINAPAENKE